MKITISQKTKTIIEIDLPDQSDETVSRPSPNKPFSFRKQHDVESPSSSCSMKGRQYSSFNNLLQLLENRFNGSILTQ
jgi:hypothetical protein